MCRMTMFLHVWKLTFCDLTLTWPLPSTIPWALQYFAVAILRPSSLHALESSRQGLSNAVCRLSLRCVVLEILGGGGKMPPNGARCSADPNGARVKIQVTGTHWDQLAANNDTDPRTGRAVTPDRRHGSPDWPSCHTGRRHGSPDWPNCHTGRTVTPGGDTDPRTGRAVTPDRRHGSPDWPSCHTGPAGADVDWTKPGTVPHTITGSETSSHSYTQTTLGFYISCLNSHVGR